MERDMSQRRWVLRWIAIISIALVVSILASPLWPLSVLDKTRAIGYAVCHQIPARSFYAGGRQLPLCARCTGTFLGTLLGFTSLMLLGKGRASYMPPPKVIVLLASFMMIWAIDGLNSYLALFTNMPHLYEPRNILRLATGTFHGLTLSIIIYPVFNFTLWKAPTARKVLEDFRELFGLVILAIFLILTVQAELDFLLYPLAILSAVAVLVLLTLVNTLIVLVATRQEGQAVTPGDALLPLWLGFFASLLEIGVIDLLRGGITRLWL